ncbi:ADAMTS-like protein 4 [Rhopilema esculentum]|uniref:ADAMTS-like protein 4 n=1 Tax=Rhopilema esculentum TaxID=499914 RepID=UPI0031DE5FBF
MTLSLYKGQGDHGNCPGFGKEFQPCNTKPCVSVKSFEDQKYDARENQCSRFDKKEYLGQKYVWLPYIREGLSECRLYCMAKGFRMFVELANRVDEGTPCGKKGNEACFNGICSRAKPNKQPIQPVAAIGSKHDSSTQNKQTHPSTLFVGNRPPPGLNLGDRVLAGQPKGYLPLGQRLWQQNHGQYPHVQSRFPPNVQQPGFHQGGGAQNQRRLPQNSNLRALNGHGGHVFQQYLQKNTKTGLGLQTNKPKSQKVSKVVSGHYNTREGLKLGYNTIFKIPVGASNIKVQEARPSPNYLALKVGDDYLVNGRWSITLKKDVKAAGTTIRYRLGKGPGGKETITAEGPTTKELQIVLLFQQGPPEVSFNYTLKVRESQNARVFKAAAVSVRQSDVRTRGRKARPTLHWSVAGWTKCSTPCGGGEQQLNIRCVAVYPSKRTKIVKSSYCHTLKKPLQRKRVCNMQPCRPRWVLLPWKPCSQTCGEGATQTRDIRCVRVVLTPQGKVEVDAPHYECGPSPAIRKACPFVSCYRWKSKAWSQCSRSCDKGVQTRKSYCTSGETIVEEQLCDKERKPERARVCNLRPCQAVWFMGTWNTCDKLCGEGTEKRLVFCAGKDGSALSESFCKGQPKPAPTRPCNTKKCDGVWFTSNWTQCSSECGPGEYTRMVVCLSKENNSMIQVSDSNCDLRTKPSSTRPCSAGPCHSKWLTTEWSHCSRTCGRGIRTRLINCMLKDGQIGRGCQVETRPSSAMICQIRACENEINESRPVPEEGEALNKLKSTQATNANTQVDSTEATFSVSSTSRDTLRPTSISDYETREPTTILRMLTASAKASTDRVQATSSKEASKSFAAAEIAYVPQYARRFTFNLIPKQVKTTLKTTIRSTTVPTTITTKPVEVCSDTFKRAYCSVILRIGFCKFTTYRKRCCQSCKKR